MIAAREDGADSAHDPGATIGSPFGSKPRRTSWVRQELPSLLGLSVTLDEAQMFPFSSLRDPGSAQGRLPTHTPAAHLEIGPIDEEVSYLFADGSTQPPDQLLPDPLVHPAHLAPPEPVGDLSHLPGGHPAEEPLRDDWIDPSILPPVACQESTIGSSRFPISGQPQILQETESEIRFYGLGAEVYAGKVSRRCISGIHPLRILAASLSRNPEPPTPRGPENE